MILKDVPDDFYTDWTDKSIGPRCIIGAGFSLDIGIRNLVAREDAQLSAGEKNKHHNWEN